MSTAFCSYRPITDKSNYRPKKGTELLVWFFWRILIVIWKRHKHDMRWNRWYSWKTTVFEKSQEIKVWILVSDFQLVRLEETGVSGDAQVSEHIYLRVTTVIGIYPSGEKHRQFYCRVENHWRQAVQKTDHFELHLLVPLESPIPDMMKATHSYLIAKLQSHAPWKCSVLLKKDDATSTQKVMLYYIISKVCPKLSKTQKWC